MMRQTPMMTYEARWEHVGSGRPGYWYGHAVRSTMGLGPVHAVRKMLRGQPVGPDWRLVSLIEGGNGQSLTPSPIIRRWSHEVTS